MPKNLSNLPTYLPTRMPKAWAYMPKEWAYMPKELAYLPKEWAWARPWAYACPSKVLGARPGPGPMRGWGPTL